VAFRSVGYPLRLHAGSGALDALGEEVRRAGGERAFVICGRTVGRETGLIPRIAGVLDGCLAGVFDEMDKDCSYPAVLAATAAAREAGADLLIAVGGGSVIVGTRAVAVFLGESGDPFELMTQYPEGRPAVSPKLLAPKAPIINVVTTPTTAMNRGGTAIKNDDLDQRMEYFDPKTRPVALFWDDEALLTAPTSLLRSTATTTFTQALQAASLPTGNPLADGDHASAVALALPAIVTAVERPDDPAPRIDLCAAALLVNRAADDHAGQPMARDAIAGAAYALATAIHIRFDRVGQGEATSAVLPTALRHVEVDSGSPQRIAAMLDRPVARDNGAAAAVAADALSEFYERLGMPVRLGQLGIPRREIASIAQETTKNFNANPGDRRPDGVARMEELLQLAW